MIPANCTVEDLKRDYALTITTGRTRVKVDDKLQWIIQTRYSAKVDGKAIHGQTEVLNDKATPELLAEKQEEMVDALKLRILQMEEGA